jgi:hypothetical protein
MKKTFKIFILGAFILASALSGKAQTTVFTYQGRLIEGVSAASGLFDMQFVL